MLRLGIHHLDPIKSSYITLNTNDLVVTKDHVHGRGSSSILDYCARKSLQWCGRVDFPPFFFFFLLKPHPEMYLSTYLSFCFICFLFQKLHSSSSYIKKTKKQKNIGKQLKQSSDTNKRNKLGFRLPFEMLTRFIVSPMNSLSQVTNGTTKI